LSQSAGSARRSLVTRSGWVLAGCLSPLTATGIADSRREPMGWPHFHGFSMIAKTLLQTKTFTT